MKLILRERSMDVPGVESFFFSPQEPLEWQAGQFLHYVLHHEPTDERGSDRWFTVASAPSEKIVRITTRFSGKSSSFKKALTALNIGDTIEASEVEGDFIINDLTQSYVFIAGGIGITPFRSILKELQHAGKQIEATLLYANRDNNIVFKDELEALAKENPKFTIRYIIAPERLDEVKIRELVPDIQKPIFHVSGPEPMVESLGNTLKAMGVSAEHIKQDWFPGYPAE